MAPIPIEECADAELRATLEHFTPTVRIGSLEVSAPRSDVLT
jgi:hypothetical protein